MIAVIISEFNKEIVDGLLEGCKKSLKNHKLNIICLLYTSDAADD